MEPKRFDALATRLAGEGTRRGLLRGMIAGVAGLFGGSAVESAEAKGRARLTIHNATCSPSAKAGADIYAACHSNGFGCVDFFFRGRKLRTDAAGVGTASVRAGTFTLSQQQSRVAKSRGAYVYCAAQGAHKRVLFDGRANSGRISIHIRAGEDVVCDWYNITRKNLALPEQCPGYTPPTTTTTTTTTTTLVPVPTFLLGSWCATFTDIVRNISYPYNYTFTLNPDGSVSGIGEYDDEKSGFSTMTFKSVDSDGCYVFRESFPGGSGDNDTVFCDLGNGQISMKVYYGTGYDDGNPYEETGVKRACVV